MFDKIFDETVSFEKYQFKKRFKVLIVLAAFAGPWLHCGMILIRNCWRIKLSPNCTQIKRWLKNYLSIYFWLFRYEIATYCSPFNLVPIVPICFLPVTIGCLVLCHSHSQLCCFRTSVLDQATIDLEIWFY